MLLHKIYFAQVFSTSSSLLQEWKQRICYGLRFGASAGGLGTPQIAWVMHFVGIYCTSIYRISHSNFVLRTRLRGTVPSFTFHLSRVCD